MEKAKSIKQTGGVKMKTMAIIAVAIALSIVIAGAYFVVAQGKQATIIPCSSCDNKCAEDSNCGNPNCGALNGKACNCSASSIEKTCGSCDGDCGGACGSAGCSAAVSADSAGKTCGCGK